MKMSGALAESAITAAPRYCRRCLFPSSKPGIRFDADGICSGCRAQESKQSIDWAGRMDELRTVCDRYRGRGSSYDCVVPVSGGKDSHAQVHYVKNVLGMNPLCLHVAPLVPTEVGRANLENLRRRFRVDTISLDADADTAARIALHGLRRRAWPSWGQDKLIYSWPLTMAARLAIPLVFMGENHDFEKGGKDLGLGSSAASQMLHSLGGELDVREYQEAGIALPALTPYLSPGEDELKRAGVTVLWLGWFIKWDSHAIAELAGHHGFQPRAEPYAGTIDTYSGIDDALAPVNNWLKFIKFGFGAVTEVAFNHISHGRMTRQEALAAVCAHEGILDPGSRQSFLSRLAISEPEFDEVVDRFANRNLLELDNGRWRLRPPVIEAMRG